MLSTLPCLVLLKFPLTLGTYLVKSDNLVGVRSVEVVLPEYFVRGRMNLPGLPTLPEVLLFSDKLS